MGKRFAVRSLVAACVGIAVLLGARGAQSAAPGPVVIDPGGDPLIGVHYALDVPGVLTGYFAEVDGIGSESDVIEHKVLDARGLQIVQKIPGRLTFLDVKLKRGITSNLDLWAWRAMVEDGDMKTARKSASIVMFDQSMKAVAQWDFVNVWPSKITAPGTTSGTSSFAVEEITLVHEGYSRLQ